MPRLKLVTLSFIALAGLSDRVAADVFHMPPGQTGLEMVRIGNPGNSGELSGDSAYGGYGLDRICGAVAYNYSIGKYEVTIAQYVQFLNAVAATDPYGLYTPVMSDPDGWYGTVLQRSGSPGSYTYSATPDWSNRPVNLVSWGDAVRFANWLTNGQPTGAEDLSTTEDGSYYLNGANTNAALMAVTRKPDALYVLPTEDEWYKAAYHKNDGPTNHYWDYATGSDGLPSRILLNPDPGNNANYYVGGYSIGPPYYRTVVGEFENSESPYGTFDQNGNLDEWNETAWTSTLRVDRGGNYNEGDSNLRALARGGDHPTNKGSLVGFRIARVPEPSAALLLTLAGFFLRGQARRARALRTTAAARFASSAVENAT